jgi:hypothetical protein
MLIPNRTLAIRFVKTSNLRRSPWDFRPFVQ